MKPRTAVSTILFVSHVNPALRSGGNEIRLLKLIHWLRGDGYRVVLLLNQPPLADGMRRQILEVVDAVHTPEECRAPFPKKIRDALHRRLHRSAPAVTEAESVRAFHGKPVLVQATGVLCRRYAPKAVVAEYVFTTPCLREIPPGVLKLVDTHDMFSRRDPGEPFYCTPEEERGYLLSADLIIAIQEVEADRFRALVPEREVVTVGVDFDVAPGDRAVEVRKDTVLVVGSNYPSNIAGLESFCKHAWPRVCDGNPRAELLVAGKIGEAISGGVPRVKVLGWVRDLESLYRDSAVVINPTTTGTGLKIKSVEALCNGKPLVATPNAVEGLACNGEAPWLACDDWSEFAGAILSLLGSDERRRVLQESALRYAREQFAAEKVYAQLADVLRSRLP